MASRVLYPPVIPSYVPAFEVQEQSGQVTIPFSLSKFNVGDTFQNIQVAVMKQGNGVTIINNEDDDAQQAERRFRTNGKVIINVGYHTDPEDNNNKSFTLYAKDIKGGQQIGCLYKVQIRLSNAVYTEGTDQAKQLDDNASNFSEWSTICVIKAIGKINLQIGSPFDVTPNTIDTDENLENVWKYENDTILFSGQIESVDPSEKLYSYNVKLYGISNEGIETLLEDSGEILTNNYQDSNDFYYLIKQEFKTDNRYKIVFVYNTINEYQGVQERVFDIEYATEAAPNIRIITANNDSEDVPIEGESPSFPATPEPPEPYIDDRNSIFKTPSSNNPYNGVISSEYGVYEGHPAYTAFGKHIGGWISNNQSLIPNDTLMWEFTDGSEYLPVKIQYCSKFSTVDNQEITSRIVRVEGQTGSEWIELGQGQSPNKNILVSLYPEVDKWISKFRFVIVGTPGYRMGLKHILCVAEKRVPTPEVIDTLRYLQFTESF